MSMTGEKKCEILRVPQRWTRKRTTRNAIEMGTVLLFTDGVATAIPATALRRKRKRKRPKVSERRTRYTRSGAHTRQPRPLA